MVWKITPLKVPVKIHHQRHDEGAHPSTADCQKNLLPHSISCALQIGWLRAGGDGKKDKYALFEAACSQNAAEQLELRLKQQQTRVCG